MENRKPTIIIKPITNEGALQLLYVVARRDTNPFQDGVILFDDKRLAVLWALVSRDEVLPKSRYGSNIAKDLVAGIISSEGDLAPFLYPNYDDYVVLSYSVTEEIPYYNNPSLTDEELENFSSYAMTAATYTTLTRGTPLVKTDYIIRSSNGNALFNRSLDNMLKVLNIYRPEESKLIEEFSSVAINPDGTLNKEGYEKIMSNTPMAQLGIRGSVANISGLKLANGNALKLEDTENINWELAWLKFTIVRDISSKLQKQRNIETLWSYWINSDIQFNIDGVLIEPGSIKQNPSKNTAPGLCVPEIRGFANDPNAQRRNFCFMDSTLIAMFAFSNSPFTQYMIFKDLPERLEPYCNKNNPQQDLLIRQAVQKELRSDYDILLSGKQHVCSLLRTILGKLCMGSSGEDMSVGVHDPYELYERLAAVFDYNPITYRQLTEFASSENIEDIEISQNNLVHAPLLPPQYSASGIQQISWPESWQSDFEESGRRGRRSLKRERLNILSAEVIVFPLIRRAAFQPQPVLTVTQNPLQRVQGAPIDISNPFGSSTGVMASLEELKSLYSQQSGKGKEEENVPEKKETLEQLAARLTANKPQIPLPTLPRPRNPAMGANELAVDNTEIIVSPEFVVNGISYILRAVVYSVFIGHFGTLLNCGGEWFSYNDLETDKIIAERKIDKSNAEQLINTRGVLFFYYPSLIPEDVEARRQIEERVKEADEQEDVVRQIAMVEMREQVSPAAQNQPLTSPTSDEELQRALEMSMLQQENNPPIQENLSPLVISPIKSTQSSPVYSSTSPSYSPEMINRVEQDFLERWMKAEILVIGASYNESDYKTWSGVDKNYIGVGPVNYKANDQVINFTKGNPFSGIWDEDPVWNNVLELENRFNKKFKTIWLAPNAWKYLALRSGMGLQIVNTVPKLLRNVGVNTLGQWIGTFNVPSAAQEYLAAQSGSPNAQNSLPLWTILVNIGAYNPVSEDPVTVLIDSTDTQTEYIMLIPNR